MTSGELRNLAVEEEAVPYRAEYRTSDFVIDALREAADTIERLQKRVAELEQDERRLDWFNNRAFTAYRDRDCEFRTLVDHVTLVDEDRHRCGEGRRGIVHATIRECIDAAINSAEEQS